MRQRPGYRKPGLLFFASPKQDLKMFAKLLPLLVFVFAATGCSVYKSNMRKDFESNSEGRVIPASTVGLCEKLNPVSAWLEKEFPEESGELLIAEPDMEIWKIRDESGRVHVRSFLATPDGTQTCLKEFPNEKAWSMLRTTYLAELETLLY
jgi:hypothetical protein